MPALSESAADTPAPAADAAATGGLRVAVVGAGPAGIYAADILTTRDPSATVDIFDRLPTPYGLIRYGVAPDHPRIKQIIVALHRVMENPRIQFFGNVHVGADLKVDELRTYYDAIVFATGAERDRSIGIPGEDLHGSYGAADFVAFYDSHPDREQVWDLTHARSVAVIGVGNVGLDVARLLARTGDELLYTDIPAHVHEVLRNSAVTDVHMFARRGPAQAKFTPVELRELDHSPNVQVVVAPEGMEFDAASEAALGQSKSLRMVVDVLSEWAMRDPEPGPHRRIHIHFLENPIEILGEDGHVVGLRTEHQELTGGGNVRGTGEFTDWEVQAVYRAVGYRSESIEDLPFDTVKLVLPNAGGRVLDLDGEPLPATYATGWVKRGPVGLIGHTKSDAAETVGHLLADAPTLTRAPQRSRDAVKALLESKGLPVTDFEGWDRLDAHELGLGEPHGRGRVKVHTREGMTGVARIR
ncbi:FAD-dependent oxidoreductase [Nakamurella endophytica]|uniref:ferredoxin--NADP(+) reductase n=1 Tax=Nakamurella endophytica TaxID=1748367 RepID=A0A917WG07_9ACTN|nr:FAD-dependent oxidoreductase [Nakamurella endophytica]GGM02163.1 pyridine nucleotide-disulfide oxidoreductase [Nakamurella endophytica]